MKILQFCAEKIQSSSKILNKHISVNMVPDHGSGQRRITDACSTAEDSAAGQFCSTFSPAICIHICIIQLCEYVCMYVCMYVCLYGNLIPAQFHPYRNPSQIEANNHPEVVRSFQASPKAPSKQCMNPGVKRYTMLSCSISLERGLLWRVRKAYSGTDPCNKLNTNLT